MIPEPRENPELVGQDAAERTLAEAMRSGRMHHAWLITGPEGIGKATLAYRFARRLLAGFDGTDSLALDPSHPVFRRVAAGTHADLGTVERVYDEKRKRLRTEIVIEDVRAVGDFLRLTPAEGGWRVVVVDGAEHLNRNSANALLKVLEEPPSRAMLLLVCSAPGRLLPTIRSRCRQLRLATLDDPTLQGLMARALPDMPPSERRRLAQLAHGSPGRALALAAEDGGKIAGLVDDVLAALPDLQAGRGHDIADAIARSETGYTTFMELLRSALAESVRNAARAPDRAADRAADPGGARLSTLRPLDAWVDVWQGLTRLQAETERFNLDKRQALIQGLALLRGS